MVILVIGDRLEINIVNNMKIPIERLFEEKNGYRVIYKLGDPNGVYLDVDTASVSELEQVQGFLTGRVITPIKEKRKSSPFLRKEIPVIRKSILSSILCKVCNQPIELELLKSDKGICFSCHIEKIRNL